MTDAIPRFDGALPDSYLPLPVAPFEHYMLADDRPEFPMGVFVRFTFIGSLDRDGFTEAVRLALTRHPLFRANISGPPRRRTAALRWTAYTQSLPLIDWSGATDDEILHASRQINLTREIGLRLHVRADSDRAVVWMHFHHACSDLIGALQFMEDALTAYENFHATSGDVRPFPSRDPQLLRFRHRVQLPLSDRCLGFAKGLARIARFLARRPAAIAVRSTPAVEGESIGTSYHAHRFTEHDLSRLIAMARSRQCTVNDLLLRDFFLVLARWNAAVEAAPSSATGPPSRVSERGVIRIGIAINQRRGRTAAVPAANVLGEVFLDRISAEADRPDALLEGIRQETDQVKRWTLGQAMNHALWFAGRFPRGVQALTPVNRCVCTAFFTNSGVSFADSSLRGADGRLHAGGLTLDELLVVPPTRPLTRAVVSAFTYANSLTLALGSSRRQIDDDESRQVLAALVDQVRQTLERGA